MRFSNATAANRWAIRAAGLIWLLLLPIILPAQTQTQQVSVSLIVTDHSNRSVKNLRLEHIQITEDGQPIKLTSLEKDDRPLRCVIALDMSGSFKKLTGVSAEVARVLIETKRLQDEFAIVTFVSSDKIETLTKFTTSSADLLNSLKLLRIEGGQSAVIDAVYLVAQAAAKRAENQDVRSVVVLLTDGEDRDSYYKEEQLVKLLRGQDVQFFILGFLKELDKEGGLKKLSPRDKAERLLLNLAKESGGRVFFVDKDPGLVEAAKQIIMDLDSQYLMRFNRQAKEGETGIRKIKVLIVNDPQAKDLNAITKPGYRVGPREPIKD
jgi:VWFA-related protein